MSRITNEVRELGNDQLDSVSGGDIALNAAIKAYEDLGKRLVAAVHQPVVSAPTTNLRMR